MLYKKCRVCEDIKEIDEFHMKKGSPDGHRNECKECVKDIQKKYKEAPGFKEKRKLYDENRYTENREAILEHKKDYHIENREKILADKKIYRKENKDSIKKYLDNYREEHREEMRDYVKNNPDKNSKNQIKYRENNPHIIAWRSVLHSTIKRFGTIKEGHTIDILGYSALEFKISIESKFTTNMSWNNYGDWHIDHIKGVINFSSDSDIREVCSLNNLQPLWATTREIDGIIYEGNLNKSKYI